MNHLSLLRAISVCVFRTCLLLFTAVSGARAAQIPPAVQAESDSLLKVLEQVSDRSVRIELHLELGNLIAPHSADAAEVHYNRVLDLSSEEQFVSKRIKALNGLAQSLLNESQYERSIGLYFQAIRLAETHDLLDQVATAYNGLGINYYYRGEYAKSADYTQRAADLLALQNKPEELATVLLNLAGIYALSGDVNAARSRISEAEQWAIAADNAMMLFKAYNTLGTIYRLHTNQPDSALYYYERCLSIAREARKDEWVMVAAYNIGEADLVSGKFERAERFIREALDLSRALKRDAFRLEIYTTLSEVYAETGRFAEAYDYRNKAYLLNDSLFAQDKQKAIEELELMYESEKKERQIRAQSELIQSQQLEAERARRRQDLLVFALTLVVLLGGGMLWYSNVSRKRKERHEREKHFIYQNIAHEIKTPLTLIRAPLKEVARKSGESISEELRLVMDNSDRLAALVDQLFDADRLSRGTYRFDYVHGNPIGQIESIAATFQTAYPEAVITIDAQEHHHHWSYPSDALFKITGNLLTNAVKYGGHPPRIALKAEVIDSTLLLEVRDNGPGISPKERKRIFVRYQRLPQHENLSGAGIGLALVHELLTQLGGEVRVENNPEGGACFSVRIPLEAAQEVPVHIAKPTDDDRPLLLIVEDHSALASFTAKLLGDAYRTELARNGKEGIERTRVLLPDLVLSDVMMPEADGLTLLSAIKGDELTGHIPVVLFSAKSQLADRLAGLRSGADAYLAKPFEPDELRLIIANLLETIERNRTSYRERLKQVERFDERVRSEHSFINRLIGHIVSNIDNSAYSVNELASDAGVSRSQLHRKVSALTGFSTSGFIRLIRLEHAFDLLRYEQCNVSEAAYRSGFSSPSYFTTSFSEHFGKRPSEIRQTSS